MERREILPYGIWKSLTFYRTECQRYDSFEYVQHSTVEAKREEKTRAYKKRNHEGLKQVIEGDFKYRNNAVNEHRTRLSRKRT